MYVKNIKLINFRNYSNLSLDFSKDINLLYGENAQGKTNILEAIYLSAIGKSPRNARDTEMIYFGKEGYYIEINLIKNERNYKIEIGVNSKKEKKIKISGREIKKISELIGKLLVILFSPDELKLIKESPYFRRRFLDILICQLNSTYLLKLQRYYKITAQRNNLLKQLKINKSIRDTLEIWDREFAETAVFILKKRIELFNIIKEKAEKIHLKLTDNKEKLEIIYKNTASNDLNNFNMTEEEFLKKIKSIRDTDIEKGFTHIGPHRDDIIIKINNKDAGKYASQGQQRTIALSLKLAELDTIKEETGESPVLLLDDVFSELDSIRRRFILDNIRDTQVFITSTEKLEEGSFTENIRYYKVKEGKID